MIVGKSEQKILAFGISNREFRCQCTRVDCRVTIIHEYFIPVWEQFRKMIGNPMRINSGFRCSFHNEEVPGHNPNSFHKLGRAIDINYPNSLKLKFKPEEIKQIAKLSGFTFIKYYEDRNFFHLQC